MKSMLLKTENLCLTQYSLSKLILLEIFDGFIVAINITTQHCKEFLLVEHTFHLTKQLNDYTQLPYR